MSGEGKEKREERREKREERREKRDGGTIINEKLAISKSK